MAAQNFDTWIPDEWNGPVIQQLAQSSAVEALARPEPMNTDTKHIPRTAGMSFGGALAKSAPYGEATGTNAEILLTVRKFGQVVRIADEDTKDAAGLVDVIAQKQVEWARSQAIGFDNACLAVTAASNGGTVPFTSLYKTLRTSDAAPEVAYTADANRLFSGITGGVGATVVAPDYDDLSQLFGLVEAGDYWSDADAYVIAHPIFRSYLRQIKGTDGHPVFNDYRAQGQTGPDRLMGAPLYWSLGAKTHATATGAPTGNPLMFVGNRQFLVKGVRSGPEYMVAGADSGPAFLTDEALLKMRIRRAFAVAHPKAHAVLELTSAA